MKNIKFEEIRVGAIDYKSIEEMKGQGLLNLIDSIEYAKDNKFNDMNIKLIYSDDEIVGGMTYTNDNNVINIDYIEVSEFERGFGYGTLLIDEIISELECGTITGMIENNYNSFKFWEMIGDRMDSIIYIDEDDTPYINEDDYDFEYYFEFTF